MAALAPPRSGIVTRWTDGDFGLQRRTRSDVALAYDTARGIGMTTCGPTAHLRSIAAVLAVLLSALGTAVVAHAAGGGVIVFTADAGGHTYPSRHCKKSLAWMKWVRPSGGTPTTICVSGDSGTISRNGKHLAFVGTSRGVPSIMTSDLRGRHLRLLKRFSKASAPDDAVWSPTGREIALTLSPTPGHAGARGLFVMSAPAGHVRKLLDGQFRTPTWSPDGSTIAADETRSTPQCGDKYDTSTNVVTVPAAGGAPRTIASNPDCVDYESPYTWVDSPVWGPPGIALSRGDNGYIFSEVLADPTGQPTRTLESGVSLEGTGAWSPDGSTLLLTGQLHGDEVGLYKLAATGGSPARLGRVRVDLNGEPVSWGR